MLRSSHPNERENKIREEDLELGFERRLVVGKDCVFDRQGIAFHREARICWA